MYFSGEEINYYYITNMKVVNKHTQHNKYYTLILKISGGT